MTKVLSLVHTTGTVFTIWLAAILGGSAQIAQTKPPGIESGLAEALYLQLARVGLDPQRVFGIRNGSLDRPAVHITLEDGTIAFTADVEGRITGAFFEGDGEVLLTPPNDVERRSLSLFTGMAILEERFTNGYFRFNDNTAAELQPDLRAPEDAPGFVHQWNDMARALAQTDAMRLLSTFSQTLPQTGESRPVFSSDPSDRMLHARLQGNTLGVFDVLFDAEAGEQVEAGQLKTAKNGTVYYDVWTSFSPNPVAAKSPVGELASLVGESGSHQYAAAVPEYTIDARIKPPKELDARVTMRIVPPRETRFMEFELSRFLKIHSVQWDGRPVEFIQNPAIEGTRLARSGNDLVAVILPESAVAGREIRLQFVYGGEVLADAGKGLLYVGARGTWYPNRGLSMSNFDITFRYPPGWTLLATGQRQGRAPSVPGQAEPASGEEQVTRWVSERPIPVAGFDLGKYARATAQAGNVTVEAYATTGVERDFPRSQLQPFSPSEGPPPSIAPPSADDIAPSPARNALAVAETTARAIGFYSQRFGPFPYSHLALTQLPGRESQGWPGLVFLSSYAFLTRTELHALHKDAAFELLDQQVPAHEAAHQWWGDLVTWSSYRDQWLSEGLANYCALMILQESNPAGFKLVMEKYRQDLLEKDKDGFMPKDAGPVTLGSRLLSSHFPEGYEAISYGRGTWLFHMLRSMLQDAAAAGDGSTPSTGEEPFVRSLRKLRNRYGGRAITTRELFDVFAEDLPPSARYEGKASLDWFLDSWVNGTSVPRLELQQVKFSQKANRLLVTGILRQEDGMEGARNLVTSVPVYALVSGKVARFLGRVFADGSETPFRFSAPLGAHKLLLDPNETVLTSR